MHRLFALLLACWLVTPKLAAAQTIDSTLAQMSAAETARDFIRAARLYERMYELTGRDPSALAGAAANAGRAGNDSLAIAYFRRAIREGYLNSVFLAFVERDSSLAGMRRNAEWMSVLAEGRRRAAALDHALLDELDSLVTRDQRNRQNISDVMARYGRNSPQGDSAARAMNAADAPVLARLREIITTKGWPGRSLVGDDGAHAAWLIVQHAPPDVQRELLPRIRAAIRAGEGRLGDLALLEDRVLVANGQPQLYGSQLRFSPTGGPSTLEPLADEACVDRRRAEMGLEPLADYLKRMGTPYTPPATSCNPDVPMSFASPTSSNAVHAVSIDPRSVSLSVGSSVAIKASVLADASVTMRGIAWRSSNPDVAVVDASGHVTAIAPGTASVVAAALADPRVSGAAMVIVR